MTCERHYTSAVIDALQEASANIEAERRRVYRAELAQELRERFAALRRSGLVMMYVAYVEAIVSELSPPVVCDGDEKEAQ